MPRSMTAFARIETRTPQFALTVSVKSVNHRYLDVQMRLPGELEPFEIAARRAIKTKVARGALQVNVGLEMQGLSGLRVRRDLVDAYLAAWREVAREHSIAAEPDLAGLFRLPGIVSWGEAGESSDGGLERALLEALGRALDELAAVREREALGIVEEMDARSQSIDQALDGIEQRREGLLPLLAERLTRRLTELLQAAAPDPQRVLQEAALLADRSDISEEVQRLRAHNAQLRSLLRSSGEVGKKLDFLLQEMHREANTIVSKTSGIGPAGLEITGLGLALKAEIEKIREQGMNLE